MLKISWGSAIDPKEMGKTNGYGYATDRTMTSLRKLGYEVDYMDPSADVHIHFDQPQYFKAPSKDIYTVIFHPWESTQLNPGWADIMNACDEVWTPSPVIADWYTKYSGITKPVHVFEHGVDPIWTPKPRTATGPFQFLHVGGEATRKGVTDAMKAMRLAFPTGNDVQLNLKIISQGWNLGKIARINIINRVIDVSDLVQLYHDNHAFVYPSYGEGFGLTPLQAMATGMPTITVPGWAPYERFLDPHLNVGSRFIKSPWPRLHPGMMLEPKMDDLVEAMRYAYHHYDEVHDFAQSQVSKITDFYDWDRLTDEAFQGLQKRLKIT
jgi:glycosyltransferase involved in cell wall biosynthesis